MPITEIYSQRVKMQEQAGQPDVFRYDDIPTPLRKQIINIWTDAIGDYVEVHGWGGRRPHLPRSNNIWEDIVRRLAHERGDGRYLAEADKNALQQCNIFLLKADVRSVLDIIEVTFRDIEQRIPKLNRYEWQACNIKTSPQKAIEELNYRFRSHGVGYQYVDGKIIRLDAEYLHDEAVKPVFALLGTPGFEGAKEEFHKAHRHYRDGNYKDAITNAEKAFESTMKSIYFLRGLPLLTSHNAGDLIPGLTNGLIPDNLRRHCGNVNDLLLGLPRVRNQNAAHGDGPVPFEVPDYMVRFALNQAATVIAMLIEAHNAMKEK